MRYFVLLCFLAVQLCAAEADPFFGMDGALSWLMRSKAKAAHRERLIKQLHDNHVSCVRERLMWKELNPRPETFKIPASYLEVRSQCRKHGLTVLDIYHDAPKWITSGENPYPANLPAARDAWRKIADRLQKDWCGWEIWNEPDIGFGGYLPFDQYHVLMKTINIAAEGRPVPLVGMVSATALPGNFFRQASLANAFELVDAVSFHSYNSSLMMAEEIAAHQKLMNKERRPLWITESGYSFPIVRGKDPETKALHASAWHITLYIRNAFQWNAEGDLCAALYGPVKAALKEGMRITEETEYPFGETVRFHLECEHSAKMKFRLRKPDWCKSFEVFRNKKKADYTLDGNWIVLSGPWKDDTVELTLHMVPEIRKVKDVFFPVEPLRACYYGPLLFALPFNGEITELTSIQDVTGVPYSSNTLNGGKCTKEFPWYEVRVAPRKYNWYAIPSNITSADCRIVRKEMTGYAWEDSPVRLIVPMICATKNWNIHSTEMTMPFGNPVYPDTGCGIEMVELVPYGCTLLRQSCFPITKN